MKKLLLLMAIVLSSLNCAIGAENNTPDQNSADKKQLLGERSLDAEEDGMKSESLIDGGCGTYPNTKMSSKKSKKSINKALDILHEIPAITNGFIAEYPWEALGAVAIFGCLMPKLTMITVGAGFIIKYKNTEVGEKISATTDKAIAFIKQEWQDISENYKNNK